jgi:hypothetical protein
LITKEIIELAFALLSKKAVEVARTGGPVLFQGMGTGTAGYYFGAPSKPAANDRYAGTRKRRVHLRRQQAGGIVLHHDVILRRRQRNLLNPIN